MNINNTGQLSVDSDCSVDTPARVVASIIGWSSGREAEVESRLTSRADGPLAPAPFI